MPYEFYEKDLIQFLTTTSQSQIDELIEDIHPADILDAIRIYEGDKKLLFQKLPEWVIAAIIDYAEDEEKY